MIANILRYSIDMDGGRLRGEERGEAGLAGRVHGAPRRRRDNAQVDGLNHLRKSNLPQVLSGLAIIYHHNNRFQIPKISL